MTTRHKSDKFVIRVLILLRAVFLPWIEVVQLRKRMKSTLDEFRSSQSVETELRKALRDQSRDIRELERQFSAVEKAKTELNRELSYANRLTYERDVLARELDDLREQERSGREATERAMLRIVEIGRKLIAQRDDALTDYDEKNVALIEDLRKATDDAEKAKNDAAEWEQLAGEYTEAADEERSNRERISNLNRKLERVAGNNKVLIADCFPNINLVRDSLERLLESESRKQIFDVLRIINDRANEYIPQCKKIIGTKDWFECRSTRSGRVYFKRSSDRRSYDVLIGDKQTQSLDIEWLKKNR